MNHLLHSTQKQINNSEAASQVGGRLQRKCACGKPITASGECATCNKKRQKLQRKAVNTAGTPEIAPPIVHEVLRQPGRPLDPATRAFMEPRFGQDFSDVRVHTDTRSAASAKAVNSLAYTVGNNMVFGAGQFRPRQYEGKKLIAHELTHAIQQGLRPPISKSIKIDGNSSTSTFEQEAIEQANFVGKQSVGRPPKSIQQIGHFKVQRNPDTDEIVEVPYWNQLVNDFSAYSFDMASVNYKYPTQTRRKWNDAVVELWSQVGEPNERTDSELLELRNAFESLQNFFDDENTLANEKWLELIEVYEAEREDLISSTFIEDTAALELLNNLFNRTENRVSLTGEFLVTEDLVALHYMLENQTHITHGLRIAEKEEERRKRLEERFAEDEDKDEIGALEIAWDIVGWDSAGEFALDVGLTVLTGGLGKITKIIVKGYKAKKKLNRIRKLAKLRKIRKIKRLNRFLDGAIKLVQSVADTVNTFDAVSYIDWIKQNWKKTLNSYITDELGETISGGNPTEAKNILERLSKDSVGEYVSRLIKINSSDEKKQLQHSLLAFASGQSKTGRRELQRYLAMNLKRRGLTNAIYYGSRIVVTESKLTPNIIVDISASTSGEMAQDFISQIFPGVPKELLETARKSIQNSIGMLIKNKLE